MSEKMGKFNPYSLEQEGKGETRIFCVFHNNETGKYRVTQADAVIVDNIIKNCTFSDAINIMIKSAKEAGEKIHKKDIKI